MNEKTSPPTGTKAQTAKATPASKAPPKQKSGGGGWFFWLFLLTVVFVGTFRYREKVEDMTGWSLPRLPAPLASLLEKDKVLPIKSDRTFKRTVVIAAPEPATSERIDELQTKVRQLSQQLQAMRETAKRQTERANSAEQQLGREIAQNSQSTGRNDDGDLVDLQLRLINLRLQLNGDSEEAATELYRVAEVAPPEMVENLQYKAALLEKTVKREDLLKMLRDMQVSSAKSKDTVIIRKLKNLFNYQRVSPWNDVLMKLKQLLLLGDYEGYLRLLNNSLNDNDKQWSAAAKANLNKLKNLGMPASHLQLL